MVKNRRILVIGGSAGCLKVLLEVLPNLELGLPFPIVIIVHRKSHPDSVLTKLLANSTAMEVIEVEDKETIMPGCIYFVPPDYHMLFESETLVSLDFSEKINLPPKLFTSATPGVPYNCLAIIQSCIVRKSAAEYLDSAPFTG